MGNSIEGRSSSFVKAMLVQYSKGEETIKDQRNSLKCVHAGHTCPDWETILDSVHYMVSQVSDLWREGWPDGRVVPGIGIKGPSTGHRGLRWLLR